MARTRWLFGVLAIGCAVLMPLAAEATLLNGFVNTSTGSWQAMQAPVESGGTAFWNNSSADDTAHATPSCNVGFVLTTAGPMSNCVGATTQNGKGISPNTDLEFLGNGGVTTPAPFAFNSPVPSSTFVFTNTSHTSGDALYWYDTTNASNTGLIFNASDTVGTTTIIAGLPASWGLRAVTTGNSDFFSNGTGFGQFALFYQFSTGQYFAGMEDLVITGGDKDYNDMIIEFTPVPEPATLFLGGLGLIAFGYAARRRLFGR